jgi:CHAT domain-containing protein
VKLAAETLDEDTSAAENAVLETLKSAQPLWKRRMSQKLAESSGNQVGPTKRDFIQRFGKVGLWQKVALALPLICLIALGSWFIYRRYKLPPSDQLIAQAYTERRTIDIRIPGARYAPIRVERGPASESQLDRPEDLLAAEALIGKQLKLNPNDIPSLQAKARADLLDGNFDSAVKTCQKALGHAPNSPSILGDLASSYYLRGKSTNNPADIGNAVEAFSKALLQEPNDPVFLFNRALADEQLFLYSQAVEDWERYLHVDPKGDWAKEAQSRLSALKEKLKNQSRGVTSVTLDPAEIAGMDEAAARIAIDKRMEDFLKESVEEWLPRAFPTSGEVHPDLLLLRTAIRRVAAVAALNHHDTWLRDMMVESGRTNFSDGVYHLALAIRSNERADTAIATQNATKALTTFEKFNSPAGRLRAELELLFAAEVAQKGDSCRAAVSLVRGLPAEISYPWIKSQFEIESGTCAWLQEDLGTTEREYRLGEEEANKSGFHQLQMRAMDHLASLHTENGDYLAAWVLTQQGLAEFWSNYYPNVRGYNFYYSLYELTRLTGLHQAQVAAWRDGLRLVEDSPDMGQRAIAHSVMANAAEAAGQLELSEREFVRAGQLFASTPRDASTRAAELEAETRLAGVELELGKATIAANRLRPLESEFRALSDGSLAILYYTNLGSADFATGDSADAEAALGTALRISGRQLRSLASYKSRLQIIEQSQIAYRTLVERYLEKGSGEAALALWERYRSASTLYPEDGQREYPSEQAPDLDTAISALKSETDLSYAFLPNGLAIWVVDDRGVFAYWLKGMNKEIAMTANTFRAVCSSPGSNQSTFRTQSRKLYDRLIAPIEGHLITGRSLEVETDGPLSGVPFEALLDRQDVYIGDREAVSLSLGLLYRGSPRQPFRASPRMSALIVAVPSAEGDFVQSAPLPEVIDEAEAVANDFPNRTVLNSREATVQSVNSHLSKASLFHFAGHSVNTPLSAGLVLSDAFLTAESLKESSLSNLELAVLSACDTEDGADQSPTGADSLVRMFVRAGVPNIVASRWNVDTVVTRVFMERFYKYLLDGDSIASSLRHAQMDLRSRRDTDDPYYWCAFGLFGQSKRTPTGGQR